MNLRKLSLTKETIFADAGRLISQPITRAVAVAVVDNPFADRFVDDLSPLFADGAELGQRVMPELASFLFRARLSRTGRLRLSVWLVRSSMEQQ
jgi:hypothetical protein